MSVGNGTVIDHEFHEIANHFPLESEQKLKTMVADIKKRGLKHDIVKFEGKILDGRNRYKACGLAGVEPRFREFGSYEDDGDDPVAFVYTENFLRRDLDDESRPCIAKALREEFVSRRKNGQSLRKIAEEMGSNVSQVRRAIGDVSAVSCETAGGMVMGKDGKLHPATKPKRRKSKGSAGGGRSLNSKKSKKAASDESPQPQSPDPTPTQGDAYELPSDKAVLDAKGDPVPACLRDVFFDPALPNLIAEVAAVGAQLKASIWKSKATRLLPHYPWMNCQSFLTQMDAIAEAFDQAVRDLKSGLPYTPCPGCNGTGCTHCKSGGHAPQWKIPEIVAELKRLKEKRA